MQAVLSISMAAAVFIHTVFGCCWHHGHRCNHLVAIGVVQPVKSCEHHQHESDRRQPGTPCKCKVECQGTCSYLVPQKVRIDAPQVVAFFDLVAAQTSLADVQAASVSRWELGRCPLDSAPSLR